MNDAAGVGVLTTDRNLRVRSWNPWLVSATGLAEEQVIGRALEELTGGPTAAWYHDLFAEVIGTGTPRVLAPAFHKFLIPCPPREASRYFDRMQQRVTVAPLRHDEDIVGLIVTIEDVTWRLDAERELAAELQRNPPAAGVMSGVTAPDWKVRRGAVAAMQRAASREDIEHLIQTLQRDHHDINVLSSALQVLVGADLEVTPALISLLSDPDPNLRMHAALGLGQLRSDAAVPALIAALGDQDANVQFHAIEALGLLAAAESVDALAEIASSGDFFLAFAAIEALGRIDDPRVAPRLLGMLDDDTLRPAIIDTLARLGDEDCVPALATLLNAGGTDVPAIAAALERIHARYEEAYEAGAHVADLVKGMLAPAGIEALGAALKRRAAPLRPLVCVLGWARPPALPALLSVLGEPSVRASLDAAIIGIGGPAVGPLLERVEQGTREERLAAAALLGRLGDRRAVPALISLLATADAELAATAAGSLASLGDARALDHILPLFAHPRGAVRQAAISAVNSIGASDTVARIVPRLDDADPHVRECAIRVAGYFGFDECLAAILDAADDPHEDVRRAAIEQLPLLQHPRAIPRFLAALANDTPRNRAAAAHAAGFVDDAASDEALVHALDDADAWVRYFAAGSVARRRSIAAVPALVEHALRDSATHVRIAALRALGALEAPHLADVAAALVRDPDADLAAAALAALASAADPRVDDLLVEAGQSSNLACRAPAVHALASRPGRQSAEVLGWAARVDEPRGLRAIAIEALRRQADGAGDRRPAAETLLALAVERDVREHALTALASLPASAVDTIAAGLTAERLPVRLAAVEALARMRHRRASEALAVALHDAAPAVRSAAVAAFGRLGTPSIGPVIAELEATDPDDAVRRRASGVCARHGWRRAFHQR